MSRVSRAWWPGEVQHCVATNKVAQQRRSMLMRGRLWQWCLSFRFPLRRLSTLVAISLLLVGMVLASMMLRDWFFVFPLAMIWCFTALIIPRLLFRRKRMPKPARSSTSMAYQRRQRQHTAYHIPVVSEQPQPQEDVFPENAIPNTPLVRVLETLDLSNSGYEHFIDTAFALRAMKQGEQSTNIPQSELPSISKVEVPQSESIFERGSVPQSAQGTAPLDVPQSELGNLAQLAVPRSEQGFERVNLPQSELGEMAPGEVAHQNGSRVGSEIIEHEHAERNMTFG